MVISFSFYSKCNKVIYTNFSIWKAAWLLWHMWYIDSVMIARNWKTEKLNYHEIWFLYERIICETVPWKESCGVPQRVIDQQISGLLSSGAKSHQCRISKTSPEQMVPSCQWKTSHIHHRAQQLHKPYLCVGVITYLCPKFIAGLALVAPGSRVWEMNADNDPYICFYITYTYDVLIFYQTELLWKYYICHLLITVWFKESFNLKQLPSLHVIIL